MNLLSADFLQDRSCAMLVTAEKTNRTQRMFVLYVRFVLILSGLLLRVFVFSDSNA